MSVHSDLIEAESDRFRLDVANHVMTVLHNDGVYRHLLFRDKDSALYWFEIITTPGQLTINGDMGCYVFARATDMFTWFGADRAINPEYWAQKLQAVSRWEGVTEFNSAAVGETVRDHLDDWLAEHGETESMALRFAVEKDLLIEYEDADSARTALEDFEAFGHRFSDVWEFDFESYTVHYLWCCHAITWAIGRYYDQQGDR